MILIFIIISCSSQNSKKVDFTAELLATITNQNVSDMLPNNKARIIIYTEKDFGNPKAGSAKFTFSDGVQYVGKRNY